VGIWENGVKALADSLTINQTLRELDLRNNKIGPQAAQYFSIALKHNTFLRKLDLRWNAVGLTGAKALLDTFKWNFTLTNVDLTGNDVPDDIIHGIGTA
jgi:Ran GTPase-activating protein (RanGAP) involved in mRNA processing and transport